MKFRLDLYKKRNYPFIMPVFLAGYPANKQYPQLTFMLFRIEQCILSNLFRQWGMLNPNVLNLGKYRVSRK